MKQFSNIVIRQIQMKRITEQISLKIVELHLIFRVQEEEYITLFIVLRLQKYGGVKLKYVLKSHKMH